MQLCCWSDSEIMLITFKNQYSAMQCNWRVFWISLFIFKRQLLFYIQQQRFINWIALAEKQQFSIFFIKLFVKMALYHLVFVLLYAGFVNAQWVEPEIRKSKTYHSWIYMLLSSKKRNKIKFLCVLIFFIQYKNSWLFEYLCKKWWKFKQLPKHKHWNISIGIN